MHCRAARLRLHAALFAFGSTFLPCEASRYRSDQNAQRRRSRRATACTRCACPPYPASGEPRRVPLGMRTAVARCTATVEQSFSQPEKSKTLALLAWLRHNYLTTARMVFATGANASLPSGGRSWLRRWPGSWRAALGSRPTRPALAGRSEPKNDHSDR